MRISDWSSDVCSSDLVVTDLAGTVPVDEVLARLAARRPVFHSEADMQHAFAGRRTSWIRCSRCGWRDRKSVVSGKRVSVRVDLGGVRIITKKKHNINMKYISTSNSVT